MLHFQRISDESIIASEDAFDILLIQSNANHTELWLEAVLESD